MCETEVLKCVGDSSSFVRAEAIKVIKEVGTETSLPDLERLLKDPFSKDSAQNAIDVIKARTAKK
ncbi:MAG: HEAT repeat domain-containing protein [Gemmataceae bacterium]